MKVLFVEPMKEPRVVEIDHSLKTLQNLVGGLIQALYPWEDEVAILCDDEGKFKHSMLNRVLEDEDGEVYDVIAGNFLIVGLTKDNFGSLSDEYIIKYRKKFYKTELFLRIKDRLVMFRDKEKARVIA